MALNSTMFCRVWVVVAAMLLVGLLAGHVQAQNRFGKTTHTRGLVYVPNGKMLSQGYSGDRDDKRNVENQPWEAWNRTNFCWVLDPVPDLGPDMAKLYYIINVKTGLALTQDGPNDRNVSNWGRITNSHRQHWYLAQVRKPTKEEPYPPWTITNRGTGLGLMQSWSGTKNDEVNVNTWHGMNPASVDWQWNIYNEMQVELMRLKIEKIRCIKPSTGKDAGTKFLFTAIEMAIETGAGLATGGASAAASTAGHVTAKQAAKAAVKQGLKVSVKEGAKVAAREGAQLVTRQAVVAYAKKSATKKALKGAALAAGNDIAEDDADSLVELAFDKLYGESPDQLEFRINGISVWPNGGRDWRYVKSQEVHHVDIDYIFERSRGAVIQLIEYDSGSADDNLGRLTLDCSEVEELETYENVIIKNDEEGSIYELTFSIQPHNWKPGQKTQQITQAPTPAPILAPTIDLTTMQVAQAYRVPSPNIAADEQQPPMAMLWINGLLHEINAQGLVKSHELRNDLAATVFQYMGDTVGTGASPAKYIFPMGNRIMVIDQTGATSFHTVANNVVGPATGIAGLRIAHKGDPPKGVFAFGDGIAVLNADGELWIHPVTNQIGPARNIPGGIGTGAHPPKAVFAMAGHVVVVNSSGDVWVNAITSEIGPASRLDGFKIGADPQPPKAIIPVGDTQILVINSAGEPWMHNLVQP